MLVLAHGPPMASCYTWEVTSKALTMAYKTLCNLASLHSSIPKQSFLSSPRSALVTWAPWQSLNSQLYSCFSQGSFHWLFFSIFRWLISLTFFRPLVKCHLLRQPSPTTCHSLTSVTQNFLTLTLPSKYLLPDIICSTRISVARGQVLCSIHCGISSLQPRLGADQTSIIHSID